jgi:membrane fusion protein, protease secretion system
VKMNQLNTEADLTAAELQYIGLLSNESRLLSERAGRSEITWVPELQRMGNDPRVQESKLLQTKLFRTRVEDIQGQQKILQEQIGGLEAQIRGLEGVKKEREVQLKLQQEEFKNHTELAAEGYVPRSKANELARIVSEMLGTMESVKADIAKTRAGVSAAKLQLLQVRTTYYKEIETQLSDAQKLREALQSKVTSLRYDLKLTELRAPVTGTVVGTKVHTVGGIVPAGQTIMEVVPQDQTLIVEAKVPTQNIDKLRPGLPADLRFTAFPLATTPVIEGVVTLVGADKIKEGAEEEYYLCQVQVTPEGQRKLGDLKVQAGMPVDVIVKMGERTFMSYIVKPITDRFARALLER